MEEERNLEEEYKAFLTMEIAELCEDGVLKLEWDYKDLEVLKDNLKEDLEDCKLGEDIVDYLKDIYYENNIEWIDEEEFGFVNRLKEDAEDNINNDKELTEYVLNRLSDDSLYDDLQECGYKGVDMNLEDALSRITIPVEIMLAPYNEQNFDMGSIVIAFGNDWQSPNLSSGDDIEDAIAYLDNGVTYLVHQQGHSVSELYDVLFGKDTNNEFIDSLGNEFANFSGDAMGGLTMSIEMNGLEFANFFKLAGSEGTYFEVSTDVAIGLFNKWSGTGSLFEIKLEKPFVFGSDIIRSIEIDAGGGSQFNYTIADVYGGTLAEGGEIKQVNQAPDLYEEDMQEVLQHLYELQEENAE